MQLENLRREVEHRLRGQFGACDIAHHHDEHYVTERFFARWRYSGREAHWDLTRQEIDYGEVGRWLALLSRDAERFRIEDREARELQWSRRALDASQPPIREVVGGWHAVDTFGGVAGTFTTAVNAPASVTAAEMASMMTELYMRSPKRSAEAEKAEVRAKALFERVAGKDALAAVQGAGLHMTGSAGTAYVLHAKMAYCVTRVKDRAKMCAVVPGVPMYDHLLGIKMIVEHDEPEFVRTANVSPQVFLHSNPMGDNYFYRTWMNEASTISQEAINIWGIDLAQP